MISNNYISGLTQNSLSALSQNKLDSLLSSIKQNSENSLNSRTNEEISGAFQQFEAMFVSQLFKLMFQTVPVDELMGGGFAEETYRDMLVDEYGTIIAKQGGIGIAENLQKTLLNLQLSGGQNDEGAKQPTQLPEQPSGS